MKIFTIRKGLLIVNLKKSQYAIFGLAMIFFISQPLIYNNSLSIISCILFILVTAIYFYNIQIHEIVISKIEYKKEINVSENKIKEEFDLETRVKNQKKFFREHKITMQSKGPPCPNCGKPTILKKTTASHHRGECFWACRDFPKCECMLSVYNGENLKSKS